MLLYDPNLDSFSHGLGRCSQLSSRRALAVALIILLIGALVGTLDIRPVLGALISNCWLRSPVFLLVCCPLFLQVYLLSLIWVSTSSFSEFACRFISRCTG
jgi:hypothetical protein